MHVRLLILFWTGALGFAAAEPTAVTAVRFWSLGDVTRVVIETTGVFRFKSDRALHPARLFFDIENARPKFAGKGQKVIPVGDRLVKQIRVAETQPGVTRVVFDLAAEVDFAASQLTNPERLIVELRPLGVNARQLTVTPSVTGYYELDTALASGQATAPAPTVQPAVAAKQEAVPVAEAAPSLPRRAPTGAPAAAGPSKADAAPSPNLAAALPARIPQGSSQSLARALGLKVARIVIDPGHGGSDTGTISRSGVYEKDVVLDVAKRLGSLIETRLGHQVIYTRTEDVFIPLEERTRLANEQAADLFVSIHANSSPTSSASGIETYFLSLTTSREALEVAARENATANKTMFELQNLTQKIVQHDKREESRQFAEKLQQALHAQAVRSNRVARNRGVKKAPFLVLVGARMPSVLCEIGFLTNPREEALLRRADYRQRLAEALLKGISQYVHELSHFEVARK